jgi:predicted transcriptional regulator
MATKVKTKALTVRLPMDMYEASSEIARRRNVSLNELVQDSLRAALKAEEQRMLYDAFTELGQHPEECDVSYALEAQREVVFRDED